MAWIKKQLDDESVFLANPNCMKYPKKFPQLVSVIFKRLSRVYAHLYYTHYLHFLSLKSEKCLNTSFKHFILFTQEFDLIAKKDLGPLEELITAIDLDAD
jgi:MOB kinase activator 1